MMSCDLLAVDVDHETHAAGVVLIARVVQSLLDREGIAMP